MDIDSAFASFFEYRAEVKKLEREIKRRRRPDSTLQRVLVKERERCLVSEGVLRDLGFDVETKVWTGKGAPPPQAALV